jgi:hypothetical protein
MYGILQTHTSTHKHVRTHGQNVNNLLPSIITPIVWNANGPPLIATISVVGAVLYCLVTLTGIGCNVNPAHEVLLHSA